MVLKEAVENQGQRSSASRRSSVFRGLAIGAAGFPETTHDVGEALP
jgi:hypothetical protein